MTTGDICTRAVVTADPEDTIVEAARRMRDHHVGAVVVVDAAERPLGILTDRDIVVSAVAQSPGQLDSLRVGDLMTPDPETALSHESLDDAVKRMRASGVRRLPIVTSEGRLTGILAFDDVLEALASELRQMPALIAAEQQRERARRK